MPSSRLIAVLAATAALTAGTVAAEVAAASDAPLASTAKKKKKKKKKGLSGIAKILAGKSLNRTIPGTTPGTERWAFCRNGTYSFVKTDYNGDFLYQTSYNGTWKVLNQAGSSGVVGLSTGNFLSIYSDGTPGPDASPPTFNALTATFGPFGVVFGSNQYSFGSAGC